MSIRAYLSAVFVHCLLLSMVVLSRTSAASVPVRPNEYSDARLRERAAGDSVLIGYWHNWDAGAPYQGKGFDGTAPYIRLTDLPTAYNVLHVAFAASDASSAVSFTPKAQSVEEFKGDVQAAKKQGRHVCISLGGADGQLVVTSATAGSFADSLANLLDDYDFDGVDIDFEGGAVAGSDAAAVASALRSVRAHRTAQGKPCYFSMAPEFPHLRGNGFYVQLANALMSDWDWVSPQFYNQAGDGIYVESVGQVSASSDMGVFTRELYKAMVTPGRTDFGAIFPQSVFVIGLPATNWAAGTGYATPEQVVQAVQALHNEGYSPKGLMTWSANWDQTNSFTFLGAYQAAF